jgi:hypothetical protein
MCRARYRRCAVALLQAPDNGNLETRRAQLPERCVTQRQQRFATGATNHGRQVAKPQRDKLRAVSRHYARILAATSRTNPRSDLANFFF